MVLLALASFAGRGGGAARPPADGPVGRSANVRFGVGGVLLATAFVLSVLEVEAIAVSACYIGGLALLVNGYLQGRIDRRKRRRR
ncbi:MAG: hypothetical protein ACT4QF_12745 [Sporichthyaceae bacterium]